MIPSRNEKVAAQPSSAAKLLTIAIPTYNRSGFLAAALENLAGQIVADATLLAKVEILVVDNASTDETAEIIAGFAGRYPFIRYRKNAQNFGIDGNIYRCCLYAEGDYVHLLSDDDVVLPGGVAAVIHQIENNPEVGFFFLNLRPFSGPFAPEKLGRPVFADDSDRYFQEPSRYIAYCWVYLTFLSSFVLHRKTWFVSQNHEKYIGTDIYLSFALFDHLARCQSMMVVAQPIIAIHGHFSGSYRMFYAFACQWRRLLLEHAATLGFNRALMVKTFRRSIRADLLPRVVNFRVNHGELDPASRRWVYDNTKDFAAAWGLLYPALFVPRRVLKMAYAMFKPVQKFLSHGN